MTNAFEDQDPVAEDDSEGQGDDDELDTPEKTEYEADALEEDEDE